MRFSKMHGAGNDFVVIDLRDGRPAPDAAACRRIADRRRGVGCDQILTVERPRDARAVAAYRIRNADGSVAGQCGNGARCIAAWLVRDGAAPAAGAFAIQSDAGLHAVAREDGQFVIDMGAPRFAPDAVPLHGCGGEADAYTVVIGGAPIRFGAVSMGNPHAVLEVADVARADVAGVPALGERRVRAGALAHRAAPARVRTRRRRNPGLRQRRLRGGSGAGVAGACRCAARRGRRPAGRAPADQARWRQRAPADGRPGRIRVRRGVA